MQIHGWALASLAVMVVGYLAWRRWQGRREHPSLSVSHLPDFLAAPATTKVHFVRLPRQLLLCSVVLLGLAFLDPHDFVTQTPKDEKGDPVAKEEEVQLPIEGTALYIVLDRSGSMEQQLQIATSQGVQTISRLEYLKVVTEQFIRGNADLKLEGRTNDLLGLIAFARTPQVLAPLTLDHTHLLAQMHEMRSAETQEENGTAIGYAIFKTANLIAATRHYAEELSGEEKPAYEIRDTAIVLVTDGLQTVHPFDNDHELRSMPIRHAAADAAEKGIHLYIVNIEPGILRPEYANELEELKAAAKATGGRFYLASERKGLVDIYQEIDRLQKSRLPDSRLTLAKVEERVTSDGEENRRKRSFARWFLVPGVMVFLAATFLETGPLRRWP